MFSDIILKFLCISIFIKELNLVGSNLVDNCVTGILEFLGEKELMDRSLFTGKY